MLGATTIRLLGAAALFALAGCSADTPSNDSAALGAETAASRDAALESRMDNPQALACIKATATEEEWAIISRENAAAERMLEDVLARDKTISCFIANNVTVYL